MKKQLFSFMIMIGAAGTLFAHEEDPMKLINTHTGFVVVEFKNGQPFFHDRFLEAEMSEAGIAIPKARQAEFEGKQAVYPGEPLFQKAFTEIYVPLTIASSVYQWQQ